MKPTGRLVRVSEISDSRRNEMFALMNSYYQNVERSAFDADLDNKTWVIEIADANSNELKGFSSQVLMRLAVDGCSIRVLFSGDTIVDRDWRGQQKLFQISGWFLRRLMDEFPGDEMYWFLISKGYKTYRFLPLFFREYYPRTGTPTPPRLSAIIDALAMRIDPTRYDRQAGVLRAGPAAYRLRPGVAEITVDRLRDLHVQFFAEANPGHAQGDELCCLAPLKPQNFTPTAYRAMGADPPADLMRL